jgi:Skp family chaperone for outer membrane proteins
MHVVIACIVIAILGAPSHAETRIAVVDSERLYEKGGVARWLAARDKLDQDRKSFRIIESPDGKSPEKPSFCDGRKENHGYEDLCKKLKQANDASREARAWHEHEQTVLGPIEAEVTTALAAFAKARRIDILFEKEKTMVYVSPAADITDAFIKELNAKPAPAPKRQ